MNDFEMQDHVCSHGFGGRGRDDKADLAQRAARDDGSALIPTEDVTSEVGTGRADRRVSRSSSDHLQLRGRACIILAAAVRITEQPDRPLRVSAAVLARAVPVQPARPRSAPSSPARHGLNAGAGGVS